jgi:hypothetical protein
MKILITPEDLVKRCLWDHYTFYIIGSEKEAEKLLKENISTEYFGKLITQNMSGFLLKNILKNMSAENIKLWYATEDGNAFEDALIALIKPTINYKNMNHCDNYLNAILFFDLDRIN